MYEEALSLGPAPAPARRTSRRADAVSWRTPVQLCCPACGRSKFLQSRRDWPPGLIQVLARCPDCEGHGQDDTLLRYADGRTVSEHARAG